MKGGRIALVGGLVVTLSVLVAVGASSMVPARLLIPGLPDAGVLADLGRPAVKAVLDITLAIAMGWLCAAAMLVPQQRTGVLDVGGYRAVRAASMTAWVAAIAALALIPLTIAETLGVPPLRALTADHVITGLSVLPEVRAAAITAASAVVIAVTARVVLTPRGAYALLAAGAAGIVPWAAAGHATVSDNHDIAVDTMLYHLAGASIWIGGLVAVLGLAWHRTPQLSVIIRRYSKAALICYAAVSLSGVGNAWVRLTYISDLWRTDYGRLLIIKASLLAILGVLGYWQRRRTIPAVTSPAGRAALAQLAVVEITLMAVTIGIAATLARTAPPPPSGVIPSPTAQILGFELPGAPSLTNAMGNWRPDFIYGTLAVFLAYFYAAGMLSLRRHGHTWPASRLVCWLSGCTVLFVATSSGLGLYAQAQFSQNVAVQMLLGMVAPLLLALGAPITMAQNALFPEKERQRSGPRDAITALFRQPITRLLTHPVLILLVFVGYFYAIYLTPLFEMVISSHLGNILTTGILLLIGFVYFWLIIGADPAPRRFEYPCRFALLLVAMLFQAFFGLIIMMSSSLIGANYYQSLGLPWLFNGSAGLRDDQYLGGAIAWVLAEVALLAAMLVVLAQVARAHDRRRPRGATGALTQARRGASPPLGRTTAPAASTSKSRRISVRVVQRVVAFSRGRASPRDKDGSASRIIV